MTIESNRIFLKFNFNRENKCIVSFSAKELMVVGKNTNSIQDEYKIFVLVTEVYGNKKGNSLPLLLNGD